MFFITNQIVSLAQDIQARRNLEDKQVEDKVLAEDDRDGELAYMEDLATSVLSYVVARTLRERLTEIVDGSTLHNNINALAAFLVS